MKRNLKCPTCGLRVEANHRFCLACGGELSPQFGAPQDAEQTSAGEPTSTPTVTAGSLLAAATGAMIRCPACSEDVRDSYAICPACGADLKSVSQPGKRGKAKKTKSKPGDHHQAPAAVIVPSVDKPRGRTRPIAVLLIAVLALGGFALATTTGVLPDDMLERIGIDRTTSDILGDGQAAGSESTGSASVPKSAVAATVVRVRGGDSLVLNIGGEDVTVQLSGSDAPSANECFGPEAKERLGKLLKPGSSVFVWPITPNTANTEGYVWRTSTTDGSVRWVNQEMLNGGFATLGDIPDGSPGNAQETMTKAESSAKRAARGLWSSCEGLAPEDKDSGRG